MSSKRIELPPEVIPFRHLIGDHGGNDPEDLLWRLENEKNLAFSNIIVFTMAMQVQSQINIIRRMVKEGCLMPLFQHHLERSNLLNEK